MWTLLAGMRSGGRFSTPAPMLQAAAAAKKLPSASLVGASLLTRYVLGQGASFVMSARATAQYRYLPQT